MFTCVRAYMSLEVKGVVEAFSAEVAEVSLCLAMAFDVSVQHSLVVEDLLAHLQTAVGGQTKQSYERWRSLSDRWSVPGTQTRNSDFELLIWSPWLRPGEQNWSSRQELAGSWQVSWRWEDGRKGQ